MQYFVYLTRNEDEPMTPPTPEGMAQMMKFMQDSMASGMVVATGQLGKSTTYVTLEKGEVSVTDGPFIEGKELIPGFTLIEVASQEEAIEWAKKLRACMGDGTLRVTPVHVGGAKK